MTNKTEDPVPGRTRQTHSKLPPDRLWQPTTAKWFFTIFGASLLYSIVRYHIAGDVAWAHFPLFILNKATSLAAVGLVASSYLIGKIFLWHDHDKRLRLVVIKFCGLAGFFMAGIHAFFSVCLLTPAYFGKYFNPDGRLNLDGEVALAVGVIALFLLLGPAITTIPMMAKAIGGKRWKRGQRLGYATLTLVVVHLVFLGQKGWFAPKGWQWGLPPISLVAVVIAIIPLFIRRKMEKERRTRLMEREQASESENAD